MTHIIIRDVALVTDLWCFGSSFGSGAPRMSVAGPSRRLPSCRRRKRLRPGVGWWGSPVRFIVDLGCGYPFLVWFVFLWLLFSGVWETLIFGTGDWFAFGEPFFCGLFTPTNPLSGHRLVPESQTERNSGESFCNRQPAHSCVKQLGRDQLDPGPKNESSPTKERMQGDGTKIHEGPL